MFYKFIDGEGKLCGIAKGGTPIAEGAEKIEISEGEYLNIIEELLNAQIITNEGENDE